MCRTHGVHFVFSETHGRFSFSFFDFGDNFSFSRHESRVNMGLTATVRKGLLRMRPSLRRCHRWCPSCLLNALCRASGHPFEFFLILCLPFWVLTSSCFLTGLALHGFVPSSNNSSLSQLQPEFRKLVNDLTNSKGCKQVPSPSVIECLLNDC
jgi:hypothetical protein